MYENADTAIIVIERLKQLQGFDAKYGAEVARCKARFRVDYRHRVISSERLSGILGGLMFVQQQILTTGPVPMKLQETLNVSTMAAAEMLLEALEPKIPQ